MANQVKGTIQAILPAEQITAKSGTVYQKQRVLIDATAFDRYAGIIPLDFFGNICAQLPQFHIGDNVAVSFDLQGRTYVDKQGQTQYAYNIKPWKIEMLQSQTVQIAQQIQQPNGTIAPPVVPAPVPAPTQAPAPQASDDLPF